MDAMQMLAERLRPLVSMKSWDYCVVWRLDKDHRFINLVGCCCGGVVESKDGEDQELLFPVSPVLPACRDFISQHPRTRNCHLLARLPPSIALDSGDHAQTLISNLPGWKNLPDSSSSDSSISTLENVGTRVLIPVVTGVLVELFVTKQVSEDPSIIEFVMAQSMNLSWEQEAMNTQSSTDMLGGQEQVESSPVVDHGLGTVDVNGIINGDDDDQYQPNKLFPNNAFTLKDNSNNNYSWMSHSPAPDNLNLPWDLSFDQIRPCTATSPFMTFCSGHEQQEIQTRNVDIALEGSSDSIISDRQTLPLNSSKNHRLHHHHGYPDEVITSNLPLMSTTNNATTTSTTAGDHCVLHPSMESTVTKEAGGHDDQKDPIKQEMGRADSISDCSDQIEDDDDHKVVGRSGRRHQSKNLVAERNRRKKLNDRLYALRALVPKITKMDRASILGDAIEFVKELQKQVKELQDELEEPPLAPEDGDKNSTGKIFDITNSTSAQLDPIQNDPNGVCFGINSKSETRKESLNGLKMGRTCSSRLKQLPQDYATTDDKQQQMEVQVDVTQVNGNEFFLKVFCEYKPSGFVRLMEAMNSLGFEVTNANVTTFRGLVLNVFKVEKRDNEIVQAEHVRESLLELTRNPIPVGGVGGGWSVSERENRSDYHHQQHRNHNYVNSHHHHHLHSLQIQT